MTEFNVVPFPPRLTEEIQAVHAFSLNFKIINDQTLFHARDYMTRIEALIRDVSATFDPIIKEATNQKKRFLLPLEEARNLLRSMIVVYNEILAKKREEEAQRRRIEELAAEEAKRKLAQAEQAEEKGQTEKADKLIAKASKIEDQIAESRANAPRPEELVASGVTTRTDWTFEIIDEKLIPRSFLLPDLAALRALAIKEKERAILPGVRFFAKTTTVVRRVASSR